MSLCMVRFEPLHSLSSSANPLSGGTTQLTRGRAPCSMFLTICPLSHWRVPRHIGAALTSFGRVHCKIATLQEDYATALQDTYIVKLEEGIAAIKEYQVVRKKLESRRCVYFPVLRCVSEGFVLSNVLLLYIELLSIHTLPKPRKRRRKRTRLKPKKS